MILRRFTEHIKEQNRASEVLGTIVFITGIVAFMAVMTSCDNSSLKFGREPADHLEGIRLGMTRKQVTRLHGTPKKCYEDACYWEWNWTRDIKLREPNLWVYFTDDLVSEVNVIGDDRLLRRAVPFNNIEEMHEILGPGVIHSTQVKVGFEQLKYSYPKWNISYLYARERRRVKLEGVALVAKDDWWSAARPHYFSSYHVSGKQVCPSEACPWNWKGELKEEFKSTTYEYFLNPSPEILTQLDNAKAYEAQRDEQLAKTYGKILPDIPGAEAGIAVAQHRLGKNYVELGNQTNQPSYWEQAVYWLTRAATGQDSNSDELNGYSLSQIELASLYESGIAVEQNDRVAVNYLLMAASQGREEAQARLATKYRQASGVQQDNLLALVWFQLAANHGDWMAQQVEKEMAELKQEMTAEQITAALDKVAIYKNIIPSPRPEVGKEAESLYKLATIYRDHGNIQLAEDSLTRAAYRGWPEAQKWKATRHMEGKGVEQNYSLAYIWFRLSQFSRGRESAKSEMLELQKMMTPEQIEVAQNKAWSCWQDFVNNVDIKRRVFNCGK